MNYPVAKSTILDIIDDFAEKIDVVAGYGVKYNAKTALAKVQINDPVKSMMPKAINKAFAGENWTKVGPIDTVDCQSIGDMIKLVCANKRIALPAGEPK